MAKFPTITPSALMRRIGLPNPPLVLDVRLPDDLGALPFVIPTAQLCAHTDVTEIIAETDPEHVVVVCNKGLKLSHGAAAMLRITGTSAEVLYGGARAWHSATLPAISLDILPETAPGSLWVTRNRPKIDRIACPWLIRRFVDPSARFLFVPAGEVLPVAGKFDAIPFGVPGASWTHHGKTCTFDQMLAGFCLSAQPLENMATVIRGADINAHDLAPECAGLLALSVGLSRARTGDLAQLEAGMILYDALYRWACDGQNETHDWHAT